MSISKRLKKSQRMNLVFYGYGREPKTPSRKKKQFTDTFAIPKNTKELNVTKEEVALDIQEENGEEEKKIFTINKMK